MPERPILRSSAMEIVLPSKTEGCEDLTVLSCQAGGERVRSPPCPARTSAATDFLDQAPPVPVYNCRCASTTVCLLSGFPSDVPAGMQLAGR